MEKVGYFIGTAGWSIASRHAEQFGGDGSHLARYARQLDCAEINSSFYKPHRPDTYARWAASVPDGFRFSVKLPKTITHELRLQDCLGPLDAFLQETSPLGSKLAVFLIQLPPSLAFDGANAERFLHDFRSRTALDIVLEPRHASWFDGKVAAIMGKLRIARVAADPAVSPSAERPGGWPDLAYFRLHGSPRIYYSEYGPDALGEGALSLKNAARDARKIWCIFDNTAAGHALGNALSMRRAIQ